MTRLLATLALLLTPLSAAAADLRLLMVEQAGCVWCARWHAEVGDAYPQTDEGRAAPLLRVDLRAPMPQGIALQRPAVFTPTFILVEDGAEVGRIEGYPGEDFFWPLLGTLLSKAEGGGS